MVLEQTDEPLADRPGRPKDGHGDLRQSGVPPAKYARASSVSRKNSDPSAAEVAFRQSSRTSRIRRWIAGVCGFNAWMSRRSAGGSARSPAAATERRENVVPAGRFRPARSKGLWATHLANVSRQRWLSPRRNDMNSSWWSSETSTKDAPLGRKSSFASRTATALPQSLKVMLPLERGQRFGPNIGWTLATRKPARPIDRSGSSTGALRLAMSNTSAFGFISAIARRAPAETDIGTDTATTSASRTARRRSGSNGNPSTGPAGSLTTTSKAREDFREGRTDVAGRALRQEAGVHEVLGFLVPDRLLQELLFHADLHRQMETLRHEADDLPVDIRNFLAQPGNFRFAQMNPPTSMRSRTVIAAAFSTTGTARGTMQGSWRPVTTTFVGCIVSRSTDRCGLAIDAVGLTTTRNVTGMPSVIPPRIPPAWFVAVTTRPASTMNGSLCSLPRIAAARNPAPNSTPLTAGIENIRCARPDSTESKKGSPTPAGRPVTAASMTPPTLSRSFRAASISAIMRSAASRSAHRTGVRSTFASISAGVTARATTRPTCAACA